MSSGIKVSNEAMKIRERVVMRKGSKLPYAVLRFNKKLTEVVPDEDSKFYCKHLEYNELIGLLPDDSPRFVLFDFPFLNKDNTLTSSVILISWFPKKSSRIEKFAVGSTFQSIKTNLKITKVVETDEFADLSEDQVCERFDWVPVEACRRKPQPEGPVLLKNEDDDA